MATVSTQINYMLPFKQTGIKLTPRMAGFKRQQFNPQPAKVTDIRGREQDFTLDIHGFQIIKDPTHVPSHVFDDNIAIETTYYDHVTDLLKKELGCSKVYILTSKTREVSWSDGLKSDADKPDEDVETSVQNGHLQFPHVDYSYEGAALFVKRVAEGKTAPDSYKGRNLPDDETMEIIKKHRWAMINFWQPIRKPVTRDSLAVCDARSVPEEDLFEDLPEVLVEKKFGTWYVMAPSNGRHRWYYQSDMRPDEALLIKCFDSKVDGRARRCPHTSFSGDKDHGPDRSSVEVRTLVCWEDQDTE